MVKSRWVYRKLRNFRAGIEAGISCLKRAYGLARCTWRGLDHFKTYIWSAGGRAQPGAARSSQTGIAPAPTASLGVGRRTQTSLSTLARKTILSAAAAISTRKVVSACQ
jgi:IS5 family transposase